MNEEFILALKQLESEKGIPEEVIIEALETALMSSYKKNFGTSQNVIVEINRDTGDISLAAEKEVVDEVFDENTEIAVEDARLENPRLEIAMFTTKKSIRKNSVELPHKRRDKS